MLCILLLSICYIIGIHAHIGRLLQGRSNRCDEEKYPCCSLIDCADCYECIDTKRGGYCSKIDVCCTTDSDCSDTDICNAAAQCKGIVYMLYSP